MLEGVVNRTMSGLKKARCHTGSLTPGRGSQRGEADQWISGSLDLSEILRPNGMMQVMVPLV